MLRPFPQYSGVSDIYGDVGQSNYNALQLSAQQYLARYPKGLERPLLERRLAELGGP